MSAWPVVPGVPATGHVTASGFWHPGAVDGCGKCPSRLDGERCEAAPRGWTHRVVGGRCMYCHQRA